MADLGNLKWDEVGSIPNLISWEASMAGGVLGSHPYVEEVLEMQTPMRQQEELETHPPF